MRFEEYGKGNDKIIVMLHGANFVHTFGRQYTLAKKYHIIVPHIMGFGDHTDKVFKTDECIEELADFIRGLHKKVMLVGFSLGAQLAFRLVAEYEELFDCAIIVSPWLIKEEKMLAQIEGLNVKQLQQLKNKFFCNIIAMMNGLPGKARKEFVRQMQNVSEQTVHNVVYNGITIENAPNFPNISIQIIALAGAKEQIEVTDSVKAMSQINSNCKYEIWDKATHNIPPIHYKKFNNLICQMYE